MSATMAFPSRPWDGCEAIDLRWGGWARCIERAGHLGRHVRETRRGNLTYWTDERNAELARDRVGPFLFEMVDLPT